MDVYWRHLKKPGVTRYVCTPLVYLLTFMILMFFTTPAAMLNAVTMGGGMDVLLGFKDAVNKSRAVSFVVGNLLPSLIILGINGLLLHSLKLLAKQEEHSRFSLLQKSEMIKLFVYWLLNMLIIPGIAGLALNNLYSVIKEGFNDFYNLVSSLFNLREGNFFIVILLFSAAFGFMSKILYIKILFENRLSPTQAALTKQQQLKYEEWLKRKTWIYNFGSKYALILVVIAIGMVFQ
jgi:Calcium-dependent channel, 7TM region, putative phosphate